MKQSHGTCDTSEKCKILFIKQFVNHWSTDWGQEHKSFLYLYLESWALTAAEDEQNYLNVSYVVADEKVTWARWNNGACLLTADLNVCLTSCTFLPFLFLSPGFIYVLRMHFSRHNTLTNVVAKSFHSTLKSQEWDLSVTSLMISILDSWVTKTRN